MTRRRPELRQHPLIRAARQGLLHCAVLGPVFAHAQADQQSDARKVQLVQPRIAVSQIVSDNVRLTTAKDDGLITTVTPGIAVFSNSGRVRGSLDYSLSGVVYTKTTEKDRFQQALAAQGNVEAISNWFYVDARASISQQTRSAFGVVSSDGRLGKQNRTDVYSLGLSPYVKGQLAGLANYQVRADLSESRAKDTSSGDASNRGGLIRLDGLGSQRLLNWSALLQTQRSEPGDGRRTETESLTGSLHVRPDVDWHLILTGGRERNDFSSSAKRGDNTYGLTVNWTPTPRTKTNADWQYHSYGNTHNFSVEHRMARSVWRVVDSQSVNNSGQQNGSGQQSNHDLLFLQFASIEPDPIRREQLVNSFLQRNGLSPDAIATSGFLTNAVSLARRQELSLALLGVRTTLTLLLSRSNSRRLDALAQVQDDLSQSTHVLQRGVTVNLAHQLTPTSSLSLILMRQENRGDSSSLSSELKTIVANWTRRLGMRTSVQLGVRHAEFDSLSQPYQENAIFATFVQQF